MKTQKGYILPIILIVLLLVLAGFFLFSSIPAESPVIEDTPSVVATTTVIEATSTPKEVNNEDIGGEQRIEEDSNATTTISSDTLGQCVENEDCSDEQVCYFKPGAKIGACTEL